MKKSFFYKIKEFVGSDILTVMLSALTIVSFSILIAQFLMDLV